MVLFGKEFDADERAEVGGGLRGGEGDIAFLFRKHYRLSDIFRKDDFKEAWRADCRVNLADDEFDSVGVSH
jgi:hypothetical protein